MSNLNQEFEYILAIEDTKGQRIIPLNKDMYSLGRASNNSIIVYDRQVSRYHATLLRQKQRSNEYLFWIVDGNLKGRKSTNGIFINGEYRTHHKLKIGDLISFGDRTKARYYQFSGKTVELFKSVQNMGQSLMSKVLIQEENYKETKIENYKETRIGNYKETMIA
ncbi:MAG: FHA domain-containing protein [Prochloraceae cyanobacterium]|nr:FHA domain-containing protein [Prochloraceae cyanobacterium]